jgi:hypothetical protein
MNGEGKRRKFWVITPIISKVWPVANPDTGWKPMLHYTVAWWLWARGTPVRKHFERSLDPPGSNVA